MEKKKPKPKKKPVKKSSAKSTSSTSKGKVYFTGVKNNKPTYGSKKNKNIVGFVTSTNATRKKKKK